MRPKLWPHCIEISVPVRKPARSPLPLLTTHQPLFATTHAHHQANHLTKEYRFGAMQGLKQTLLNSAARLTGKKVEGRPLFKALDDVSFSIQPGEVVGIIGHSKA